MCSNFGAPSKAPTADGLYLRLTQHPTDAKDYLMNCDALHTHLSGNLLYHMMLHLGTTEDGPSIPQPIEPA